MILDRPEVIEFLGKAQSKIGELGSYVAVRKHDKSSNDLLEELVDVIKAMTSEYNKWTVLEAQGIIDYYNLKAGLNDIPYVKIVGWETRVAGRVNSGGKTTTVNDLVDYISRTVELINNTPHNNLQGKQGGKIGEYYHVTKEMYEWLFLQLNPFVMPTVDLTLSSGLALRELGASSLNNIVLYGSYVLNSSPKADKARYYRGNTLLAEYSGATINNNYTNTSVVRTTTTFRYEVDFPIIGTKSVTRVLEFALPYYYGIDGLNDRTGSERVVADIAWMTKVVSKKPAQIDVTFEVPDDNATTMLVSPSLLIPASYGEVKKIYVDNNTMFDYSPDWEYTDIDLTTVDGQVYAYRWYKFIQATEGTFNFNFRWQ